MKNLVIYKTHFINNFVLKEINKLKQTPNIDVVVYLDNQNKIIKTKNIINFVKYKRPVEQELEIICTDEALLKKFKLPVTDNREDSQYSRSVWYNSDYPFYIAQKYYPDYDYYWTIEEDVYSNAKDYSAFFKKHIHKKADALLLNFSAGLYFFNHYKDCQWIYKDKDVYTCFFPIVRLSSRAVKYLKKQRLEHSKIYEKMSEKLPKNAWVFCEIFVPTELAHCPKKMTIKCMLEKNLKVEPEIKLSSISRKKEDGELYHPVKTKRNVK